VRERPPVPSDASKSQVDPGVAAALRRTFKNAHNLVFRNGVSLKGFTLQTWSNDPLGGASLLKYDDTKKEWFVVATDGGGLDAPALMKNGVPEEIAVALVANLARVSSQKKVAQSDGVGSTNVDQGAYADPIEYCRASENVDYPTKDPRYNGPKESKQIIAALHMPDETLRNLVTNQPIQLVWRCMGGKVWTCTHTNNKSEYCGKAEVALKMRLQDLLANQAVIDDCQQRPNAECAGATHCLAGCNGNLPIINKKNIEKVRQDARGFDSTVWRIVSGGPVVSAKPDTPPPPNAPQPSNTKCADLQIRSQS
jgi:hypothetical protein